MAAVWITKERVWLSGPRGNAQPIFVGVVQLTDGIKFGAAFKDSGHTTPDIVADLSALSNLIAELNKQRRELTKATGGFE